MKFRLLGLPIEIQACHTNRLCSLSLSEGKMLNLVTVKKQ